MKPLMCTWRQINRSCADYIRYTCSLHRRYSNESSVIKNETKIIARNIQSIFNGLINGDRASLATAITLIESQHPVKKEQAQRLMSLVMKAERDKINKTKNKTNKMSSFRIGLSGPPGAGKSTFIEALGLYLVDRGHKVAVLTIDPSSSTSGGSILGDKTRMVLLSRDRRAYIRPSPTSGHLGGVTRTTNESIILCECAGFDIVIVETVGVGQSEFNVAYMVDFFALLIPPAGGDELQGLKRGIVELANLVIVNKADGNLLPAARLTQAEYLSALKFISSKSKLWKPQVLRVSSLTKEGIPELWDCILKYWDITSEAGELNIKRQNQYKKWLWNLIESQLLSAFHSHPAVSPHIRSVLDEVNNGIITPGQGADFLIKKFLT